MARRVSRGLQVTLLVTCALGTMTAFASQLTVSGGVLQAFAVPFEAPTSAPAEHCTYSMGYWKNHPEAWPADELVVGDTTYSVDEAIGILKTPAKGDASFILAHQLIPALLNVAAGVDGSSIDEAISQAQEWVVSHPVGTDPAEPERGVGISIAETLEAFNTGESGPASCDAAEDSDPSPQDQSATIVLEVTPMAVPADGDSVVAIMIRVEQLADIASPGPVEIILTTTLGTFTGGVTEGVVEVAGDTAQVTFYAGKEAGDALVTAMLDGSTAQVIIEFTEPVPPPPEQDTPTPEAKDQATPIPTEEPPSSELTATQESPTPLPPD